MEKPLTIGVLAVQGNFREHTAVLRRLGVEPVEVRLPEQLQGLDGLIIPGGESTAIGRLMRLYGLDEAVQAFAAPQQFVHPAGAVFQADSQIIHAGLAESH